MIVGFVTAYQSFMKSFQPECDVNLIRFKNSKMGFIKLGGLYFCLCSPLSTSDGTLRNQCQQLSEYCSFFHGPISHIKERMESVEEFEYYIKQIGAELVPVVKSFMDRPTSMFNPVPHTELPPKSSSLFIKAHDILTTLMMELPGYLGGAILFDQSVLCTQVDHGLLKYFLHKNLAINEHFNNQTNIEPPSASPRRDSGLQLKQQFEDQKPDDDWVHIQLEPSEQSRLQQVRGQLDLDLMCEEDGQKPVSELTRSEIFSRARKYIVFGSDDRITLFPIYFTKSKMETLRKELQTNQDAHEDDDSIDDEVDDDDEAKTESYDSSEDGEYACLVIAQLSRISLCMILDLKSALHARGTTISSMRSISRDSLKNLEQKIIHRLNTTSTIPTTPSVDLRLTSPTASRSSSDLDDLISDIPYNQQPFILKDGVRLKCISSQTVGSPSIAPENVTIDDGYHSPSVRTFSHFGSSMLMYDSYNKMVTTTSANDAFILRSAIAHECFESDPSINKLFLKNATGFLYAKKLFGSQYYYHQSTPLPANNVKANDVTNIDQLESGVRSAIRREFCVNLF
ncbi:hypothetical protein AKO1_015186 [Acrasis kona]|uniref:CCZ1/INTU/HSP4 first Longin domain-containing protein n=1 Tax=Acrasis kona TaxID=1008807 RepID=A0AAW2ZH09_9EUKA